MRLILGSIGAVLFLVSVVAHVIVRRRMRPSFDSDLDDYYYEFEEEHPGYARYLKWSRITFAVAIIATLMLFVALAV